MPADLAVRDDGLLIRVTELDGEYKCPVEFTSIETKAAQTIKEFVDSIVEFNKL